MLFDNEDVALLKRVIVRKGYEVAMVAVDDMTDELGRRAAVDGLVRQISTARMMISLANNDLADLAGMLRVLEENLASFPLVRTPEGPEAEDEASFLWMAQTAAAHLPFLHGALELCEQDNCSIDDRDARTIMAVRGLMVAFEDRCSDSDPEVLGDAAAYVRAIDRGCGVLLRIHSLKGVPSAEIARCIDELDSVSQDDFDSLFSDSLDREQALALSRFRSNSGRYVSAMYARCVQNSRNPELEGVRDAPLSGRSFIFRGFRAVPHLY